MRAGRCPTSQLPDEDLTCMPHDIRVLVYKHAAEITYVGPKTATTRSTTAAAGAAAAAAAA